MDQFTGINSIPKSLHKYLYVSGDPINQMDPSGYFEGSLVSVALKIAFKMILQAAPVLIPVTILITAPYLIYLAFPAPAPEPQPQPQPQEEDPEPEVTQTEEEPDEKICEPLNAETASPFLSPDAIAHIQRNHSVEKPRKGVLESYFLTSPGMEELIRKAKAEVRSERAVWVLEQDEKDDWACVVRANYGKKVGKYYRGKRIRRGIETPPGHVETSRFLIAVRPDPSYEVKSIYPIE